MKVGRRNKEWGGISKDGKERATGALDWHNRHQQALWAQVSGQQGVRRRGAQIGRKEGRKEWMDGFVKG